MRGMNLEGGSITGAKNPKLTERLVERQREFIAILMIVIALLAVLTPVGCATLLALLTPAGATAAP